jgi:hypothetical protein
MSRSSTRSRSDRCTPPSNAHARSAILAAARQFLYGAYQLPPSSTQLVCLRSMLRHSRPQLRNGPCFGSSSRAGTQGSPACRHPDRSRGIRPRSYPDSEPRAALQRSDRTGSCPFPGSAAPSRRDGYGQATWRERPARRAAPDVVDPNTFAPQSLLHLSRCCDAGGKRSSRLGAKPCTQGQRPSRTRGITGRLEMWGGEKYPRMI